MKLNCILTAVNNNTMYMDFIEIFIKTWNKLYPEVDVKIIFIINEIPNELKKYENNFIHIPPDKLEIPFEGIPVICTYIRFLYPALMNYDCGVMITDIDMLPMNNKYFTEIIKPYSNDKYINTRDWNDGFQFACCYNVATPKIWSDIWNIKTFDDIVNKLKYVWYYDLHNIPAKLLNTGPYKGWYKDQIDAYNNVLKWNKITNNFVVLKDCDTKFRRLCRGNYNEFHTEYFLNNVKNGYYTDYHCYRPFKKYEYINMLIYNTL